MLSRRRLTLLDTMLLVAASALGAWFLSETYQYRRGLNGLVNRPGVRYRIFEKWEMLQILSASLSAFPPTLCVLGLSRPRIPSRVLTRQPGFIACCVWTVTLLTIGLMRTLGQLLSRSHQSQGATDVFSFAWTHILLTYHLDECGLSVAAAWLTLALTGRWRPESSWVDRMGRAFGLYFIAITPLAILMPYVR